MWESVTAVGPLASTVRLAILSASESCHRVAPDHPWSPPYDFVVEVGGESPLGSGQSLRVHASGWGSNNSDAGSFGDDTNPVGPLAAASVACAESFKAVFADCLTGRTTAMPPAHEWSAWDIDTGSPPPPGSLDIPDLHIFGVGAVSHGLLWLLERWPSSLRGTIHLVDPDLYDESNAQRYIGMRAADVGRPKVDCSAERLRAAHPSLTVEPHRIDMNSYFREIRPDYRVALAVAGLDSIEGRRQLALKLPRTIVNLWTDRETVGAGRFKVGDGWACAFCVYSESVATEPDEAGIVSQAIGLDPYTTRELLASARPLTAEEAQKIAQKTAMIPDHVVGRPLRSVWGDACATMTIPGAIPGPETDVPLPFASALAGVGGMVELVHELRGPRGTARAWQYGVLNYPLPTNWQSKSPLEGCYLCGDGKTAAILQRKYVEPEPGA
jgi:hypothetical protein